MMDVDELEFETILTRCQILLRKICDIAVIVIVNINILGGGN